MAMEFGHTLHWQNATLAVHPWTILYAILGTLLLYTITLALYNLYLHPLRSIPGPLLSRAFPIPHALRIISGHGPMQVHQLHEKYGPVVRVSPNHLTFTDLDAYKTVYGHRVAQAGSGTAHVPENPKCLTYYKSTDEIPVNILMADRDEHARLRRALSHGFSDRAMREQEPLIARYLEMLVQGIKEAGEQGRKPLDMVKWYNWITFDIIGDLTFAESFGCLEKRTTHPFVELITATVDRGAYLLALRYLRLQWAVLGVLRLLAGDPLQFLNKMLGDKVKNRLAVEKERYDLFEGLVKRREEWNLGVPHLTSNAILLIAAGSETTASLLSGVTYLLLENPEALEKLKHEVRSSFKSADEITIASASRLPYLLACLNEALRRWPPAAANLPREVHEGGETILGRFVPEKTIVEVQLYSMHHSSQHWHDPYTYRPERFLHKSEPKNGEDGAAPEENPYGDNLEALQAFSIGPRNCLGKNLAYAEMRLILARIIWEFDLRPGVDLKDWYKRTRLYTIFHKPPFPVYMTPVKR